ncbi:MAG: HEAT repeat domain-containing protein [Myxococcales bacterium]|nr:HEAT repeat domain-containing protein [Myxococcales bacterium]
MPTANALAVTELASHSTPCATYRGSTERRSAVTLRPRRPGPAFVAAVCALLVGCAESPEEEMRRLMRERNFDAVAAHLASTDDAVACRAAKHLAWARGPELVARHLEIVVSSRCGWEIPADAGWRLAEELTGDARRPAVEAILPLLASPDEKVRWNMARVLGMLAHEDATPVLTTCKSDPNEFVAAWCTWSLCRISGGDCKKPNMDVGSGDPAP